MFSGGLIRGGRVGMGFGNGGIFIDSCMDLSINEQ